MTRDIDDYAFDTIEVSEDYTLIEALQEVATAYREVEDEQQIFEDVEALTTFSGTEGTPSEVSTGRNYGRKSKGRASKREKVSSHNSFRNSTGANVSGSVVEANNFGRNSEDMNVTNSKIDADDGLRKAKRADSQNSEFYGHNLFWRSENSEFSNVLAVGHNVGRGCEGNSYDESLLIGRNNFRGASETQIRESIIVIGRPKYLDAEIQDSIIVTPNDVRYVEHIDGESPSLENAGQALEPAEQVQPQLLEE